MSLSSLKIRPSLVLGAAALLASWTAAAQLNPTVKVVPRGSSAVPADCDEGLAPTPVYPRLVVSEIPEPAPAMQPAPPSATLRSLLRDTQRSAEAGDRAAFRQELGDLRAMVAGYPRGGERDAATAVLAVYDDLDRLWTYSFESPQGAFFDASTDEGALLRMLNQYPEYGRFIARQTVTASGTMLYPSAESRQFLVREAAKRAGRVSGGAVTPAPAPAPRTTSRTPAASTSTTPRSGTTTSPRGTSTATTPQRTTRTTRSASVTHVTGSSHPPVSSRSAHTTGSSSTTGSATPTGSATTPGSASTRGTASTPGAAGHRPSTRTASVTPVPKSPRPSTPPAPAPVPVPTATVATATVPTATVLPTTTSSQAATSSPTPASSPTATETTASTDTTFSTATDATSSTATETTASATETTDTTSTTAAPAPGSRNLIIPIVLILIGLGVLILLFRASS